MLRNIGISSVVNVYRALLQFALNLVLVAFLDPADFGLVALVLPATLFVLLIGDLGLAAAIVRAAVLEPRDAGAALGVIGGFAGAIVAAAIAASASGFMDGWPEPVPELALAFSAVVVFALAAVVPRALLERRLRYGAIGLCEAAATTAAFAASCLTAWRGGGVWSFAVFHLVLQVVRAAAMGALAAADVRPTTRVRRALPLLGFGGWLLAGNLVGYCGRNLDNYIIGGLLGTAALGAYAFAYQVMLVPMMTVTWPVSGVLTSTLSRLQGDAVLVRRTFLAAYRLASLTLLPGMILIAVRAPAIVAAVFPQKWQSLGPVLGPLAATGGLQAVTALVGVAFVAKGRVRLQLLVNAANTAALLSVIAGAALLTGSLEGVATAYLAGNAVSALAVGAVIGHLLGGAYGGVLKAYTLGLAASAAAITGLSAVALLRPTADPVVALVLDFAGYGAGWALFVALLQAGVKADVDTLRAAGRTAAGALRPEPAPASGPGVATAPAAA